MRRRRSRNRSESAPSSSLLGKLPGLVLFLVLALPAAEWGADAVLSRLGPADGTKPVPFSDKDLAKLYETDQPGRYHDILAERRGIDDTLPAPMVEYRMAPYQGKYVTIDQNGIRGGVAGGSGPVVAVFGGEAVFGGNLADDETIPSAVAKTLADRSIAADVRNYGTVGRHSSQQRIAFAQMLVQGDKPAAALFVDGMSDFMICGRPDHTAWSNRLARAAGSPSLTDLVRQTALAKAARRLTGRPEPDSLAGRSDPACAADAEVENSLARLEANRRMIAAMGRQFGVKVMFVQLPVAVFHYDNAKRTVPVEPARMEAYIAAAKGYARLAENHALAASSSAASADAALWLAELEPAEGQAYVGPVDYTPNFAALIGREIAIRLADRLAPPPASADAAAAPAGQ